jgi:hypothetical protein
VTPDPPPRARLPERHLTRADLEERDRYAKLAAGSADTVRASAQAWRTGLTAFITLVTTGVVIKGRDSTAGLPANWRILVIVLVGGGLLLTVLGLWQALAAEAGTRPQKHTLQDIRDAYGTLTTYQVHLADTAAGQLRWGIRAAAAAITLLIAGIAATWVAPGPASSPADYLTAVYGNSVTCGTLQSAAGGQLRLTAADSTATVVIPFAQITSLALTTTCP